MPKISHPLSESERILFHANYKYMWDKISTTYFAVLRSKTPPSAKIDEKKLPSYAICAKCNNDESYAPSRATIAKIVDFYNSQIRPPVEVYQFTHERLEDSDNIRYRSSSVFDPRFIGTYRGYYPSVTEDPHSVPRNHSEPNFLSTSSENGQNSVSNMLFFFDSCQDLIPLFFH